MYSRNFCAMRHISGVTIRSAYGWESAALKLTSFNSAGNNEQQLLPFTCPQPIYSNLPDPKFDNHVEFFL